MKLTRIIDMLEYLAVVEIRIQMLKIYIIMVIIEDTIMAMEMVMEAVTEMDMIMDTITDIIMQ